MNRITHLSAVGLLVSSLVAGVSCSRKGEQPQEKEAVLEVAAIEDHNALTSLNAQAETRANELQEAAGAQKLDAPAAKNLTEDLGAFLEAAKRRHADLETYVRPKEKATVEPLHQTIDEDYAKATEDLGQLESELAKPSPGKQEVGRLAKAIHEEIINAESKHLEIKAQRAESDAVEFVDIVVYQDHDSLSQHHGKAAEHAEKIQAGPAQGDWKAFFQAEAEQIKAHLETAKESLAKLMERVRASEKEKLTPDLEAIRQYQAKAEEDLQALQKELAKPKPNREAAQKHAAAVHDDLTKAEQAHEKVRSARSMPASSGQVR